MGKTAAEWAEILIGAIRNREHPVLVAQFPEFSPHWNATVNRVYLGLAKWCPPQEVLAEIADRAAVNEPDYAYKAMEDALVDLYRDEFERRLSAEGDITPSTIAEVAKLITVKIWPQD